MLSWDQCRKLQVGYSNTLHGRAWFNHHLHRSLLAPCMGSSARCLRVDMGVQPWSMGIKSNRWEDVSLSDCLPSCQPLPNHPKISLEMIPWVRTIEAKSPGDVHRGWNTRIQSSGDHWRRNTQDVGETMSKRTYHSTSTLVGQKRSAWKGEPLDRSTANKIGEWLNIHHNWSQLTKQLLLWDKHVDPWALVPWRTRPSVFAPQTRASISWRHPL